MYLRGEIFPIGTAGLMHQALRTLASSNYCSQRRTNGLEGFEALNGSYVSSIERVELALNLGDWCTYPVLRGGSAVGRWTCDLQVAGSIPGR